MSEPQAGAIERALSALQAVCGWHRGSVNGVDVAVILTAARRELAALQEGDRGVMMNRITRLRLDLRKAQDLLDGLRDPATVLVNILRGSIVLPECYVRESYPGELAALRGDAPSDWRDEVRARQREHIETLRREIAEDARKTCATAPHLPVEGHSGKTGIRDGQKLSGPDEAVWGSGSDKGIPVSVGER